MFHRHTASRSFLQTEEAMLKSIQSYLKKLLPTLPADVEDEEEEEEEL